jgi:hypothetical protein
MEQSRSKSRNRYLALLTSGAVVIGAMVLTMTACSDDPATASPTPVPTTGADAAVDSPNDAAPTGCPLQAASLVNGKVHHLGATGELVDAADVRVCIHERPDIPCVTTANDGTFEHTCVPEGDTALLFSKSGFASTLWLRVITPGIGQTMEALVLKDSENAALFAATGVTYPRSGYGLVTMNDLRDTDGVVVTPEGTGTDGPFYSSNGTAIDRDAGSSTGDGLVFTVAPVGKLKLRITGPDGGACQQAFGGWQSTDSTVTVPVLENTETSLFIACQ